jgi:zinc finger SWIM domain-containing protein 3
MLRHALSTYSQTIFKLFQKQVLRTLNYETFLCGEIEAEEKVYTVKFHSTKRDHIIRFIPKQEKVNCSCKRSEFAGILCSHCLKVLDINNIKHIPQEYMLKRWTLDAKVLNTTRKRNHHDDPKVIMANRYKDLCKMYMKIAAHAAESDESYDEAASSTEQLAQRVEKCLKIRADPELNNSSTTT